jgi:hypothetical protein
MSAKTIQDRVAAMGIGSSTLERVKARVGIQCKKSRGGAWLWFLPGYDDDGLEETDYSSDNTTIIPSNTESVRTSP